MRLREEIAVDFSFAKLNPISMNHLAHLNELTRWANRERLRRSGRVQWLSIYLTDEIFHQFGAKISFLSSARPNVRTVFFSIFAPTLFLPFMMAINQIIESSNLVSLCCCTTWFFHILSHSLLFNIDNVDRSIHSVCLFGQRAGGIILSWLTGCMCSCVRFFCWLLNHLVIFISHSSLDVCNDVCYMNCGWGTHSVRA